MSRILILFIFILFSPSKKATTPTALNATTHENKITNNSQITYEELDNLLKCGDYSYVDNYFTIPDNGCIYEPNGLNKLGNVEVYLIPKTKLESNFDIEREENKINLMNTVELKKRYNIFLFIIEKKYLKKYTDRDIPYYPVLPYEQIIYKYDGEWKKYETLKITSESGSNYVDLKNKIFNPSQELIKKNNNLEGDFVIKTKVSSVETGDLVDVSFYFNFKSSEAILSIGATNSLDAYCEGIYNIIEKDGIIKLIFMGEGTCTSDKEESAFYIKKENNEYFIKSIRFYEDTSWQKLIKK